MIALNFDKLKRTKAFTENVRWEVTPKLFLNPDSGQEGEPLDLTHGYMLYIDIVDNRPALVVMVLKRVISKTAGYIHDLPEELMKESMQCDPDDCIGGMYPLSDNFQMWLKKEFGLT